MSHIKKHKGREILKIYESIRHFYGTHKGFKNHRRFRVFWKKGVRCRGCSLEGNAIVKTKWKDGSIHHDLYHWSKSKKILMTVDHIIPKSYGGKNDLNNLQPLCEKCNSKKGNQLLIPFLTRMNNYDKLYKFCEQVREDYCRKYDWDYTDDLNGECCDISLFLYERLVAMGQRPRIIEGDCYEGFHHWVELEDFVIDLSIKQFEYFAGVELPFVFIKPITECINHKALEVFAQNEDIQAPNYFA